MMLNWRNMLVSQPDFSPLGRRSAYERMMPPVPRVGDAIYVDDTDVVHQTYIRGGLATVSKVEFLEGHAWVSVAEVPGGRWAWEYLAPMQDDLRTCFAGIPAGKYIM
jgi:hypothetical protein